VHQLAKLNPYLPTVTFRDRLTIVVRACIPVTAGNKHTNCCSECVFLASETSCICGVRAKSICAICGVRAKSICVICGLGPQKPQIRRPAHLQLSTSTSVSTPRLFHAEKVHMRCPFCRLNHARSWHIKCIVVYEMLCANELGRTRATAHSLRCTKTLDQTQQAIRILRPSSSS
jgi:hypothetical protein